jgi:YgiT-type zinc finger domain-containing protein
MKCVICKNGETKPGKATITLNRGETSLVFKEVPAEICDNCGEPYTDQVVTEKLQESARQAERDGAEVVVRRYVA